MIHGERLTKDAIAKEKLLTLVLLALRNNRQCSRNKNQMLGLGDGEVTDMKRSLLKIFRLHYAIILKS